MAFLAFRPPRLSGTRLVGTLQANYLDKARPNEGTVREVRDGVSRRVGVQADAPLVCNHQAIPRGRKRSFCFGETSSESLGLLLRVEGGGSFIAHMATRIHRGLISGGASPPRYAYHSSPR